MNGHGWCFAVLALSAAWAGCGGISEPGARRDDGGGGGDFSEVLPDDSSAGHGVRAELVWTAPLSAYGLNARAFLSVDPSEERVLVPPDQSQGTGGIELALLDGMRLARTGTPLLGRDAAWTRDLRLTNEYYYGIDVLDRGALEPRLVLAGPFGGAGISRDGRYVVVLDCNARTLVRHEVETGEALSVSLAELPAGCPSSGDLQVASVVVVPGVDRALLAWSLPGALVSVDFRARTASLHTHLDSQSEPGGYQGQGTLLSLEPSPSGRRVAVAAFDAPVRVFEVDDLVVPALELGSSSLGAFDDCYCAPRTFAPLAWSPDERTLALLDEEGRVVLRRSADGAHVGELPPTVADEPQARGGAHLLAFTPSGRGIVTVTYGRTSGGQVAYYRLGR